MYGYKQVIDPWTSKLTITKDDEVIATGTYDKDEKLIKIDSISLEQELANAASQDNWTTVHR